MAKKVVILGAGYGGIEAALTLQKKKKKNDELEIYIIDKNPYHTLLTELHEIAANRVEDDGVLVYLSDIFQYSDVNVVQDFIEEVDFKNQVLKSKNNNYTYDYLILGLGSEPNYFGIDGMQENSLSLWSYDDAIRIKHHILDMFTKAAMEPSAQKRKSYLTFVVGGGGFTGTEMIGELAFWTKDLAKQHHIDPKEIQLILIEALPDILPILDKKLVNKSTNYLTNKLGVQVLTSSRITKVTDSSIQLNDSQNIDSHTLIWTGGVQAYRGLEDSDLKTGRAQRVYVDEYTKTAHKNVFAVGDFSLFTTKDEKTLPALVESALHTGKCAALNILNTIRGKELKKCNPKLHGVMVSMGRNYAVADLMGTKLSWIFALIMKHIVNLHYLFGIGGFEILGKYINHEFFETKHKQGFIEKHLTKRTPNFWLVILRLYLGYMWLIEGIHKIQDGWLTNPMLAGSAVDGTTSASLMVLVSKHTPGWYAWIADQIIVPNAVIFQKLIIVTEIGLGLAFITGTFTFIAALVSIGMNINFLLSTGLNDLWYLAASFTMLGGAGRSFGVDHYLIPYLMKQWRYFVRNRMVHPFLKKNKSIVNSANNNIKV